MPDRRYFFAMAEIRAPNGGTHVNMDIAERIAASGRVAAMLYPRPDYHYRFRETSLPGYYSPAMTGLRYKTNKRWIGTAGVAAGRMADVFAPKTWPVVDLKPSDVIVAPEFRYPEVVRAFPGQKVLILAQGVFAFLYAFHRDRQTGAGALEQTIGLLTSSDACARITELIDAPFCGTIGLDLDRELFAFEEHKRVQVALTPRKRPDEAALIRTLLKERLPDLPVVEIADMSREEAARLIRQSLFFISLSYQEGLGLPPAEAMSTGGIAVGYTGVGGDEYFRPDLAFPIQDGDIVSLIGTMERLVAEYRENPERLDRLRREASKFVQEKYDKEVATSQLIATWRALEKYLEQENASDADKTAART